MKIVVIFKIFTVFFFLVHLAALSSFAQTTKVTISCAPEYGLSLYNQNIESNKFNIGVFVSADFSSQNKFYPTVELGGALFPQTLFNKFLYPFPVPERLKEGYMKYLIKLLGGYSYNLSPRLKTSFLAGGILVKNKVFFGVQPSSKVMLFHNKKYFGRVAYYHIFKKDYGCLSFSFGREF